MGCPRDTSGWAPGAEPGQSTGEELAHMHVPGPHPASLQDGLMNLHFSPSPKQCSRGGPAPAFAKIEQE